jgi:2-polyprenyl-3-methyl-5-hydroxy-6-metoxy-1,4-benzoquinol methylase
MELINYNDSIRVFQNLTCYLCGTSGDILYRDLKDYLFDVPGEWSLKKCPNLQCGLIWLDPMPVKEDIGKAYQTYYTHDTATTSQVSSSAFYQMVRDGYLRHRFGYTLGVGPTWYRLLAPLAHLYPTGVDQVLYNVMFLQDPANGARLLDIGCGSGLFLSRMRDLGWQVEGNDLDPLAVAAAQAKGLCVRSGDLLDQNYPDACFSAVTMSHVIEHVYDPVKLLKEVRRVLKQHGKVVLLTPNTLSLGHRYFRQDWRGLEVPRHIYLFNSENIRQIFFRAGFSQVKVQTLARGARYILSMSDAIRRVRIKQNEVTGYSGSERKFKGMLYQFWERGLYWMNPHIGEELLVFAEV